MDAQIQLGERTLLYRLKRSPRRRTVAISIHPEQGLVVHSPVRISEKWLHALLLEKAGWILSKTIQAEQARAQAAALRWAPGALLPYQGAGLPLRVTHAPGLPGARLEANAIVLNCPYDVPGTVDAGRIRAELLAWYREQARLVLHNRVAFFERRLGLCSRVVRVKDHKRRWGSCSAKGALNFNWRLILAPPDILDYVVVHEISHLRVLDHSPRFWSTVAGVLPDYRERKDWLRRHGANLSL
jgi:predicted metal-dependent hydrolase